MTNAEHELSALAAVTAECLDGRQYEAARFEWLQRAVGFDALYCGEADSSPATAPTVSGVEAAFVERCESRHERYWHDRMVLNDAAARNGGAVFDGDVLERRARARMPFYREIVSGIGVRAIATVLLRARGRTLAHLYLGRTGRGARFLRREVDTLRTAAPILGLGVVLHPMGDVRTADAVASLSPREHEIATLVCRGMTNQEIANLLGTSPRTVKNQMASIFRKAHVSTRAELAAVMACHARSSAPTASTI